MQTEQAQKSNKMAARQSEQTPLVMCSSPSLSLSSLVCRFDHLASEKNLSGKSLEKEAHLFWTWAIVKGYYNCPFPEWLVKFHLGDWDPHA